MSFSLIGHAAQGSANGVSATTAGFDTTGANLIIVFVGSNGGAVGVPPVSDSKGNTWMQLTSQLNSTDRGTLYYSFGPTVGAAHTFTVSLSSSFPGIAVQAWGGGGDIVTSGCPERIQPLKRFERPTRKHHARQQ